MDCTPYKHWESHKATGNAEIKEHDSIYQSQNITGKEMAALSLLRSDFSQRQ
jgi:hypothetical protein